MISLITLSLSCARAPVAAVAPDQKPDTLSPSYWTGDPVNLIESRALPATGTHGMVVAADPTAAEWGAEILRAGGNAVDAAVATAFALSVSRPHLASLGGGGFLVFCPKPQAGRPSSCHVIDYRETAPSKAAADTFLKAAGEDGKPQARTGALASGTPGTVAGLLLALEKYGKMPRTRVLERPISLAERGIPFSTDTEKSAANRWNDFNSDGKKLFGCGKKEAPCAVGSVLKQPDLAKVLREISKNGKNGFYRGWVAQKIASSIQASGGLISETDLASYQPKERMPLSGKFGDYEVVTMPPPSGGGIVLLQLLRYAELAKREGHLSEGTGSSQTIHTLSHAMALAYVDRAHHFADADFSPFQPGAFLNENYLASRWKTFSADHASLPSATADVSLDPNRHTTHLSVIDREGNAVALTTTINDLFGSGFIVGGTGIVMNNEMDDFRLDPRPEAGTVFLRNLIEPGKKPLSSMSPTIVRDGSGNARIVLGAAGGTRIPVSIFLTLLNRLEFGMSLPDAMEAPRFHHQWRPNRLYFERYGLSADVKRALIQKGYALEAAGHLATMNGLERLPNGRVWGMSDSRGDGAAAAE